MVLNDIDHICKRLIKLSFLQQFLTFILPYLSPPDIFVRSEEKSTNKLSYFYI